jgi:ribonucleoside-diphosphate reductase beta chain
MSYSVFDSNNRKDATQVRAFFDDAPTIARYDKQKYAWIEKLTDKQLGFFWRPEEVDIYKDAKDFKDLTVHEQHIFTSNLKRQILLDSVQGRAPTMAFGPICSLPELETWITTWAFSETIHSRSYTHIIRNIYPNPSKIFDEIMDIPEIVECAGDISKYYDDLIEMNNSKSTFDLADNFSKNNKFRYNHKKALWLALMSVNVLEGVRFYVSFACSWAFAEVKRMEGNAKIIKFIARDENLHLAGTQQLLKALPKEDEEFARIAKETRDECINLFVGAVEQEKAWASYLFRNGSMVGLNEALLSEYIEWIANKRMTAVGLPTKYKGGSNPLPWTQKWISGSDVQVAPQETEITSYVNGGVKKDVNSDTFKGFSL